MNCPGCGGPTDVKDSRPIGDGGRWRRRRLCRAGCGRFTTVEIAVGGMNGPRDVHGLERLELSDDRDKVSRALDAARRVVDVLERVDT